MLALRAARVPSEPLNRAELRDWIAGYERVWRTPGTDALAELFADDASYSTAPYGETHRGLEAIAALWDREREGPDEAFEMTAEVVAVEGDTGSRGSRSDTATRGRLSTGTYGSFGSTSGGAAWGSRSGRSGRLARGARALFRAPVRTV